MQTPQTNIRLFGALAYPVLIASSSWLKRSMLALKVLPLALSLYIDSVYPSSIQVPLDLHKNSRCPKMN